MQVATDVVASIERLIRRDRLLIAIGLAVTIGLAWVYLLREASAMEAMADEARRHAAMGMAGMNMRAWGAADWAALFVMWTVMMIGMMLPVRVTGDPAGPQLLPCAARRAGARWLP